jgi:hypothetical protein
MTGKQTGVPRAEHGLGYSVVSELSSNHRNKHHHIVLDNAFTSPVYPRKENLAINLHILLVSFLLDRYRQEFLIISRVCDF